MFEQFIGTKPVEERHRIDVAALEKFLGMKISAIEQFKGGQSNPTYKINDQYVLRRKPPGKLLPSAHAVDREYRVISALHKVGFPVARPHLLCEDDSVIGTAFYVMEYVEGRVLWDQSLPGMTQAERGAIWDELNRVIALLHTIDYEKAGLQDFGKPGNYIERQIARWTKQYQASETGRIEAMDNLIAWLPKNIPPSAATTVV
ncbi:MAG: aminoglycoside phosphotransferase, partial [Burkholderiales bacterium]|nr:aminoglycoside phosphotransferase [Burkholderiales bacterium]